MKQESIGAFERWQGDQLIIEVPKFQNSKLKKLRLARLGRALDFERASTILLLLLLVLLLLAARTLG
jgi:hypothetical protein